MDKLVAMRTFRRVVECGGFASAARDLNLSNAAVSGHVRDLENALGVALLTRTTRKVATTEAGRAYYDRCARVLDDIDDAERALTSLQSAPRGLLRINCPMALGTMHIAPAVARFARRYPEIRVDLVLNDRNVDMVEEGFDVSLRVRAKLDDSSLIARRLCTMTAHVCAAPSYLAEHGEPKTPADLSGHKLLVYSVSSSPGRWTFRRDGTVEVFDAEPAFIANSSLALRHAIREGVGISWIPTAYVIEDLLGGDLVPLLRDYELDQLTLWAMYPSARHLSPKVRAFVDFMVEAFADPPWSRI